ncbi:hypothetical protein [Cypionkella sp.]|jgi:cell pole-organizing protein PopZ|uniref:hypothetical protein n=1 Tax=Cypionkella sp. TaxID=2811411 RepID=UPI00271D1ADB|nr:hypothetical protein [Cypionkella sp.]MDO8984730.1 hypothetical protein [Cypionkella sp.]MDP2050814.1 hypothetical protein [Cypionkella sp.]
MSEPLSSTEIEDVLSSIRRLVSDDMRPTPKLAAAAGDKLILTPALRVVQTEAEVPEPLAAPLPMFVAVPRTNLMDAPRSGLGDVVASVGAAVDASPDDWEAETGDCAPQPDMGLVNPWSLPADDVLVDEPLASNEDDLEPHDPFEYHAAEAAAPAQTPAWAQEDEIAQDDEAEATTAPLRGTVEPDPVWADAAEASVLAALAKPDAADDDEAFDQAMRFDEDVLRELVRDMLREELAGKMGERITRNIRKLVRAEIARALAAQEFE